MKTNKLSSSQQTPQLQLTVAPSVVLNSLLLQLILRMEELQENSHPHLIVSTNSDMQ